MVKTFEAIRFWTLVNHLVSKYIRCWTLLHCLKLSATIHLNGYGNRLNVRANRLLSVYNRLFFFFNFFNRLMEKR